MGLDFSHGNAHWAYSGFNRFRSRLAAQLGVNWEGLFKDRQRMEQFVQRTDPIMPLLNHSDCDGSLTAEECVQVAAALRAMVKDWPDSDWDKGKALELADGMEEAVKKGEEFIFC